ncbi:protease inhibitor I42 family protein [Clostridium sp. BNL1100]|uniref:protease inhibitor I42 family protein n=1 Tax=Clostridium sp. BNL1100 TaxID=755731 RepID=UPI00024A7291|nr:protease inhibitor I42 family protein [Clostridium sp. BNL1100]AEY66330.1 putative secreted protein [Clostridium sp. BNL1100]
MEKNYTWKSMRVMKCISVLMSVFIFSILIAPVKVNAEASSTDDGVVRSYTLFGDLNSDNKVDSLDYAKMKMVLLGTNASDTVNMKAADLNGDEALNSLDLVLLKKLITGEIRTFPVESKYPSTYDNSSTYLFLADSADTFQISLKENGSTGYQWDYVISDADAANLISVDSYCFTPNLVGTPIQKVWTFKAVKSGKHTIQFTYRKPWETDVEPLETVKYDIYVSNVGGTINIKQGDSFNIALISGGIFGGTWKYSNTDETAICLLNKEIIEENPGIPDALNLTQWTFTAVRPGSYKLIFEGGSFFSNGAKFDINVV